MLLPIMIVVTWLYFALMEASAHQATSRKDGAGAIRDRFAGTAA